MTDEQPWMSKDLLVRLRWWAFKFCGKGEHENLASDAMSEAGWRIEKLEAALKHCINALRQYEMGDDRPRGPAGPVRPWLLGAMDNAIETLEGKDD